MVGGVADEESYVRALYQRRREQGPVWMLPWTNIKYIWEAMEHDTCGNERDERELKLTTQYQPCVPTLSSQEQWSKACIS